MRKQLQYPHVKKKKKVTQLLRSRIEELCKVYKCQDTINFFLLPWIKTFKSRTEAAKEGDSLVVVYAYRIKTPSCIRQRDVVVIQV